MGLGTALKRQVRRKNKRFMDAIHNMAEGRRETAVPTWVVI
jgi:hypothetical protein